MLRTELKMLSKMLMIATQMHNHQFDKGGNPYILHPIAVMNMLPEGSDEITKCIAIGHDLIEDTIADEGYLKDWEVDPEVIGGIKLLTRWPGQLEREYRAAVASTERTIIVKKRDLRHNSDLTRLKGVTQKDLERTVKYYEFYDFLNSKNAS